MTKFLKTGAVSAIGLGVLLFANTSNAHHSFAIYDLDNPIIITGTLESLEFRNPHTMLVVNDVAVEGSWAIESMAPSRWDNVIGNRDIADIGDTVTIRGWPAVNGGLTMALGTITSSKGVTLVREEITQNKPVESDEERARLEEAARNGEGGGMGGMGDGGGMGGMGDGGGMGGMDGGDGGMGDGGMGGMADADGGMGGMGDGGGMGGMGDVLPTSAGGVTDGVTAASSGSKSIWAILGALLVLVLGGVAFLKSRKS